MIDLHSHILPGMDDGSESPEMSRAMLQSLARQGVEAVVATPHFYAHRDTPDSFLQRRAEAVEALAYGDGQTPKLLLGAEVSYFEGMSRSEDMKKLQIGQSGLLLVEMPFGPWTERMIDEICLLPKYTGLTPVLAHVERYRGASQMRKFKDKLLRSGVLFQCSANAMSRLLQRQWVLGQIKRREVHFLGSDAHNLTTRAPQMDLARQVISGKLGAEFIEDITRYSKEILKV